MATAGASLWSTTAATNSTADPAVNWGEGQAPSTINDSARAMMASVAKWRDDLHGTTAGLSTGGTATAFTVTTNSTYATAAVMSGAIITIIPHTTSGAAPTLAVDGLTARALNVSTGVAIPTGALISGTPYFVRYKHASTEFIIIGPSIQSLISVDIVSGTSLTGVASNDLLPIYDLSATANKQTTVAQLFAAFSLAGAQLPYGAIINGTIAESNGSNATTYALKTLAGTDPNATDPVLLCFRNATIGTGNYVYRTVTAALSLVIPSGATMGFTSGISGKLWLTLFDDAGTIRIGAINCLSGANIYPLGQTPLASSTTISSGADVAQVFYSDAGVTTKPYLILGYACYETGVATAGSWNVSPTRIQIFGPGVQLPGERIQTKITQTGAEAHGTQTFNYNDTIPDIAAGIEFMTQAITPTSGANVLEIDWRAQLCSNSGNSDTIAALFQDSVSNSLTAGWFGSPADSPAGSPVSGFYAMLAATTSPTTFKIRCGSDGVGTTTFNGSGSARKFGGVSNSWLRVVEFIA